MRSLIVGSIGLFIGVCIGVITLNYFTASLVHISNSIFPQELKTTPKKEIIGFLPYWLVSKAHSDYSDTITTLTYFGLVVGDDGKIQYLANAQEEEPGWHMLRSEKMQNILKTAKANGTTLSLLVFSGDADAIDALVSNPILSARNLVHDVAPIMQKYGFTDINLDIESTKNASNEAQMNFTRFTKEVYAQVKEKKLGTVTVEVSGNDLIRKTLIDPKEIGKVADYVVIMAYDFHYMGSSVTGPVAPVGGSPEEAEFDTNIVLSQAYKMIPRDKIVLGIPSYGYSWETLGDTPRSAVMPGSGLTVSNRYAEEFLRKCSSCSAQIDTKAAESYVIYKDTQTGTFYQAFYPDKLSTQEKVELVTENNLAGIAVWALGYEGGEMLTPLKDYKKNLVDISRL